MTLKIDLCGNIDLDAVAIETFIGSAYGAMTGSAGSGSAALKLGKRFAKVGLSGLSAVMRGVHNGGDTITIIKDVGIALVGGAIAQLCFIALDKMIGNATNMLYRCMRLVPESSYGTWNDCY